MWGVSVYAGLEMPEIATYLKKVARFGASKVFTSLHIPEASSTLMGEFFTILDTCAEEKLLLYVDTSAEYYQKLPFDRYPNLALRLDFGFSDEEIIGLAQKHPLVLNASTLTASQIERLHNAGIDWSRLSVCYNYYPRPETGLSLDFFREKNRIYTNMGLDVDAFIAGSLWKRPPLGEGLPTIERHRNCSPLTAAQECLALGASCILFGDMASDKELEQIALLQEESWVLPVRWLDEEQSLYKIMEHRNRPDPGDGLVRSELSRGKEPPLPKNCYLRPKGSITVDNKLYGRYGGELHITAKDFPADNRVNVLGYITDGGILVDYIRPNDKWIFTDKTDK
ncbi:MAG: MupG family TIM beta-alpha barrel fold protein [Brevinema sp.]